MIRKQYDRYRLYIGSDNKTKQLHPDLEKWIKSHLTGCTMMRGTGIWQGMTEESLIVEILIPSADSALLNIRSLAVLCKKRFNQDSVMLTVDKTVAEFL